MRGNPLHVLIRSHQPINNESEVAFLARVFAAQNRHDRDAGKRCENYSRPIIIRICDRNKHNRGKALAEALRLFCESFQITPGEPVDLQIEACSLGIKELSQFGEKRLGNLFSVSSGGWISVHLEINSESARSSKNRTYFVIGGHG